MKWTQTLIPTLRQVPADATVPSHQLMLRAGVIRQTGAGLYSYLPLGFRALTRTMQIVREEMNAAGAVELLMPALEPFEFFKDTKRDVDYGANLFVVTDRHGRKNALAPTHEEVITEMMMAYVESYKQLPLNLYQIQTKFRDEFRPRFGVLRCREFIMKDAYSFHVDLDGPGGLNETYDRMYAAYERIFSRCGLDFTIVDAESGPIGGSASHEFMANCDIGEDTILMSDKGNYAANVEKCDIGERATNLKEEPKHDLKKIATPDCTSIEDLCKRWKEFAGSKLKPANVLKTLVYRVEGELTSEEQARIQARKDSDRASFVKYWIAVVRGDHEVNEAKLKEQLAAHSQREVRVSLMDEVEAKKAGFRVGYVGPHACCNLPDETQVRTYLIVDPDAAQGGFWVVGANEYGHHITSFNWQRDVLDRDIKVHIADIRNAMQGDPSPKNDGGTLRESKGIELGHVFKLGSKYSDAMGYHVLDENQKKRSVMMGCYGIGIGRIVAAAIEQHHDENGILWPKAIAPFDILITPIKYEGEMKDTADRLYDELHAAGLDVLLDDRKERPGPKFKDGDLIGIPIRITIGQKTLAEGAVEFYKRDGSLGRGEVVKIEDIITRCTEG